MKGILHSTLRYLMKHEVLGVIVFTLIGIACYAVIDALAVSKSTQVEFADLTNDFCRDHIRTLVTVEGYLRPGDITTGCAGTRSSDMHCVIRLYPNASGWGRSIPVSVDVGSRANQMEPLLNVYEMDDLQFRDDKRNLLGISDRVIVTGKLDENCTISVRVIKAVP